MLCSTGNILVYPEQNMSFIVLVSRKEKKKLMKMNGWFHKTGGAFSFHVIAQRAFTKDRRKLGLMALRFKFLSPNCLQSTIYLGYSVFWDRLLLVFFSYAKIINHAEEQEVELKRSPCQVSILVIRLRISISTFTRLRKARLRASASKHSLACQERAFLRGGRSSDLKGWTCICFSYFLHKCLR